jgi:tryptophan-rich sensory protein
MAASLAGFVLLIALSLWLWMAWANKGGRSWARIMATVFFGLLTAGGLAWLIIGLTRRHPSLTDVSIIVSLFLVYWLASLCAVVLLWERSSSDYYTAVSNWSKATRAASRKPHDQSAARQVTDPGPD